MQSKLKCPKCKSNDLFLTEHYHATKSFLQENGVIDTTTANGEYGNIHKLTATCVQCVHEWTVRRIMQVTNL